MNAVLNLKWRCLRLLIWGAAVICVGTQVAVAQPTVAVQRESLKRINVKWSAANVGPVCGVYSACIALESLGVRANPANFMSKRFIGSGLGSSPQQVSEIIKTAGCHAVILEKMSLFDLEILDSPVIVNVRSTPSSAQFDHWALVSSDGRGIVLYDGSDAPRTLKQAEFLGLWSGLGIIVTNSDAANVLQQFWLGRCLLLFLSTVVAFGVKAASMVVRPSSFRGCVVVVIILAASIFLMLSFMLVVGDLPHYSSGVETATAPFRSFNHTSVGVEDLQAADSRGSHLLIDARLPSDYMNGSIPSAVNIPVFASIWSIRDFLVGVPKDTPIIVFCQSSGCPYSEVVAKNLSLLGFFNVALCEAGWKEFRQRSTDHNRRH